MEAKPKKKKRKKRKRKTLRDISTFISDYSVYAAKSDSQNVCTRTIDE